MSEINADTAGDIAASSYNRSKEADLTKEFGYDVDKNLSKPDTRVWRKEGKPSIIVHRGSRTFGDWADDALISVGLGSITHRYRQARRVTKAVEKADNGEHAIHVGHSLGGYLAQSAGKKSTVYTYNKHAIGFTGSPNNKKQTDTRTVGDLASLPGVFERGVGKKRTVGQRDILAPFSRNTLINPLKAHKIYKKQKK